MDMKNPSRLEDTSSGLVDKFLSELGPKRFSKSDLMKFTSNFSESNKIGFGGYGEVYKGQFPSGVLVAVKVLDRKDMVEETFMAEIRTISKAYHRNLVKLYGYCFERDMKALVYEYMENGSLDKILYENHHRSIKWEKLYCIAVEIGRGLHYLHDGLDEQIIHYDIKAANVLLDQNYSAKITDFGLAKLMNRDVSRVDLTRIRGTAGYNAPETWMPGSQVSCKCDVYSFGMMLFEILGKRRNGVEENWFPRHVWKQFENGKLDQVIRDCGITEKDKEKAKILCEVALCCAHHSPEQRPSMVRVMLMLEEILPVAKPSYPFLPGQFSDTSMLPSVQVIPPVHSRNERFFEKIDIGREKELILGEHSSKSMTERTTLLNKASQLSNENQTSQVPDIGRELHERHASVVKREHEEKKEEEKWKEEKKGEEKEKTEGEGEQKEKKEGEEEGKTGEEENLNKVEFRRNEFSNYPPKYRMEYAGPRIYSDKKPKSCSIM